MTDDSDMFKKRDKVSVLQQHVFLYVMRRDIEYLHISKGPLFL